MPSIEAIRRRKEKLGGKIAEMLNDFQDQTDLEVTWLSIEWPRRDMEVRGAVTRRVKELAPPRRVDNVHIEVKFEELYS